MKINRTTREKHQAADRSKKNGGLMGDFGHSQRNPKEPKIYQENI